MNELWLSKTEPARVDLTKRVQRPSLTDPPLNVPDFNPEYPVEVLKLGSNVQGRTFS
jgi:hypothetical protein